MYRLVCLVAVIWSVNDYFYIAGSLNAENLHGDIWLNFSLVALTELPAVFVGTFLMGNYPLQRHNQSEIATLCCREAGPALGALRLHGAGHGAYPGLRPPGLLAPGRCHRPLHHLQARQQRGLVHHVGSGHGGDTPPSPVSCADCVPADHPHQPAQLGLHHLLHRGQVCRDDGTIRRGFGIYGHNIQGAA